MKTCSYCGRENADEAARCLGCGKSDSFKISVEGESLLKPIRPWVRWGLYFAAWGAVIFATLATNPANIVTAPGFPIGLAAMLPNGKQIAITAAWLAGPIAIGAGWTIYSVLTVIMGCTKKISIFLFVYIVFCILLALNIVGCQRTLEAVSQIH